MRCRIGLKVSMLALLLPLVLAISSAHPASIQEASPQTTQFRAGVSQVRVDVVVTDDEGDFVGSLGPGDFTVSEDDQSQEILQVQLVDLIAGRVTTVAGVHPMAGGGSPVPPVPDPQTSESNLPVGTIESGDYGAMVYVIQTGRIRQLTPLTYDMGELRDVGTRFLDTIQLSISDPLVQGAANFDLPIEVVPRD